MFSSRVTPDFYHLTLSLCDNMNVCFLSWAIDLFGLHCEPLTSTQKFRISPQVSYTHTKISDNSTGLLHPHRNFRQLPGSLTPTQKFRITLWVSYTHTKISGLLPGSLTPTHKFGISPWVSYTHTKIWDISLGLLHLHRNSGYLLGSLTPTHKFGISP